MPTKDENLEFIKTVLIKHGIKMIVSSCGCCDGPHVLFEAEGRLVVQDGANFRTHSDFKWPEIDI